MNSRQNENTPTSTRYGDQFTNVGRKRPRAPGISSDRTNQRSKGRNSSRPTKCSVSIRLRAEVRTASTVKGQNHLATRSAQIIAPSEKLTSTSGTKYP